MSALETRAAAASEKSKPDEAWLMSVPVFSQFSQQERTAFLSAFEERSYTKSQAIITQGEQAEGFFLMFSGCARVIHEANGIKKDLDLIVSGDYFGEAALINRAARGASVVADADEVRCLFLHHQFFDQLLSKGTLKDRMFAKRQGVTTKGDEEQEDDAVSFEAKQPLNAVYDKSKETAQLIFNAVKSNMLFEGMNPKSIQRVISKMWKIEIPKGTCVITQGEVGDNFYVVEKGRFNVYHSDDYETIKQVDRIKRGQCFGELALMYNSPRNAFIASTTNAVLWAVDRFTFRSVLKNMSSRKLKEYQGFLAKVPLLQPLSAKERGTIAVALDELQFSVGEDIVVQSTETTHDAMYIIVSGEAKVHRQEKGEIIELRKLRSGDAFGERALMTNEPRSATVTAVTVVEVVRLDRVAVTKLLGPLQDILNARVDAYDKRDTLAKNGTRVFHDKLPAEGLGEVEDKVQGDKPKSNALKGRVICQENLVIVSTLGKGCFGRVHLVKDLETEMIYAMKVVNKAILTKAKHRAHILSEKDMLVKLTSQWIICLYATFKDQDRIYFLLECCLGGELYALMRQQQCFDDISAQFYVGAVIMGFDYMHNMNIVYRDLKPENVMLDSEGYPKIVDLGFATELGSDGRTYTLCGTPAYLSPEIIGGTGYGKGVDWWCVGVFTFELLAGYPPFRSITDRGNMLKLYERIRAVKYSCPAHFNEHAVHFVGSLLKRKPHERIALRQGGVELMKKHKWYKDFDWKAFDSRNLRPPLVPFIEESGDIANSDIKRPRPRGTPLKPYVSTGWDKDF